jgi:hypothetical protein
MKILKRFLLIAWILFLLILTGETAILSSTNESRAELTDKGLSCEDAEFEEKELDIFLKGKEYVFKRQWRKARQSWDQGEYGADPLDFGQAKAEIPRKKGKWTLKGYIVLVKKERRFIARRAVLYNPQGKTVARADQIIVPVDNPSQYKATGKKTN